MLWIIMRRIVPDQRKTAVRAREDEGCDSGQQWMENS
jgi:hypothetical protein